MTSDRARGRRRASFRTSSGRRRPRDDRSVRGVIAAETTAGVRREKKRDARPRDGRESTRTSESSVAKCRARRSLRAFGLFRKRARVASTTAGGWMTMSLFTRTRMFWIKSCARAEGRNTDKMYNTPVIRTRTSSNHDGEDISSFPARRVAFRALKTRFAARCAHRKATLAEWLRRSTRMFLQSSMKRRRDGYRLGNSRVGSNPAGREHASFFIPCSSFIL